MARKTNGDERPGLTESPEQSGNGDSSEDNSTKFVLVPKTQGQQEDTIGSARSLRSLHPYTRPLTVSDLDSCVALENAAFENPAERCSPEKVSPLTFTCSILSPPPVTTVPYEARDTYRLKLLQHGHSLLHTFISVNCFK